MTHETAPVSGLKWTRRNRQARRRTPRARHPRLPATVARLLKAMGYSLRVNHKKLAGASNPNRDQQFQHITALRERCAADNSPLISVDTKKKELVGTFRNPGAWDRSPELVNDHDFRSDADGRAVPYGIYDPRANAGPSSSAEPPTPRRSPSTASRMAHRGPQALSRSQVRSWPTAVAATAARRAPGSSIQHRFCNRTACP